MIETFLLSTQILKGEIPVINISASGTNFSPVLKSPLAPISFVVNAELVDSYGLTIATVFK